MKQPVEEVRLPDGAVLVTCSSHEDRCRGFGSRAGGWSPGEVVLFHYYDDNPIREENHRWMESAFREAGRRLTVLQFTETDAVASLRSNLRELRGAVHRCGGEAVVIDISVFTKRHLLMMLRWLDDSGLWDISRPVHLMIFLGDEDDRVLAVYEQIQPLKTSLAVPDPRCGPEWIGRAERFNRDLLVLAGPEAVRKVDALDPDDASATLADVLGGSQRDDFAKIVCPLGTNPQTLGIYDYVRQADDPPAIVYAGPLRHNHTFYSTGFGETWVLRAPGD